MEVYRLESREAERLLEESGIEKPERETFRNFASVATQKPELRVGPGSRYELVTNQGGREYSVIGKLPAEFPLDYNLENVVPGKGVSYEPGR